MCVARSPKKHQSEWTRPNRDNLVPAKKQHHIQLKERRLAGTPISDGIVCRPVRVIVRDNESYTPRYTVKKSEMPQELARLRKHLDLAAEALDEVIDLAQKRVGPVHATIFQAQKMIILDEMLYDETSKIIHTKAINAEAACVEVLDSFEARFLAMEDTYLKDRASDIGEVRRRILTMFFKSRGEKTEAAMQEKDGDQEPTIVVIEELLPGETLSLNLSSTAGFVTEHGGPNSHVAILARSLGIPAVCGVQNLLHHIKSGDTVLMNGATGEIIINPQASTLKLYPTLKKKADVRFKTVAPVDGFKVLANINSVDEARFADEMGAEGIGLYRTEFEFIVHDRILTEDEQYERYAAVIKAMNGRPISLRLADLGGDKAARFLSLPREENPALGYRGARVLLGHPELLAVQARAIARASVHGPVQVMYPMIISEQQFLRLRAFFLQSIAHLECGEIRHGVMFEVPAACICADSILKVADFGSIGSNDLIQYLLAVDRDNSLVADDYDAKLPAFWHTISHVVAAAQATGKELSICGEVAGQPRHLAKLIDCGIRSVSVSPRRIGLARIIAKRSLPALASEL